MVIIDNTRVQKSFADLRTGIVFKKEYEDGSRPNYCIRIPSFFDQRTQGEFNAIDLEDGSWYKFDPYEQVIPYEATLSLDQ